MQYYAVYKLITDVETASQIVVFSGQITHLFYISLPASPPKFVSIEEIMKAAQGVSNMVLAHEIAVDNEFSLKRMEAPEDRYLIYVDPPNIPE